MPKFPFGGNVGNGFPQKSEMGGKCPYESLCNAKSQPGQFFPSACILPDVGWDEHAANEQQERVSPWEIEPCISVAGLNVSSGTRIKRLKTSLPSTPVDFATPDGGRLLDFGESVRFQKVLQGQEMMPFRAPSRIDGVDLMKCRILDYKGCDTVVEGLGRTRTGNEIQSSVGISDISSRILDFGESVRFQKVLQGQEIVSLKAPHKSAEVDLTKCRVWDCKGCDAVTESFGGERAGNKNFSSLGRPNVASFSDLYSTKGILGQSYMSDRSNTTDYSSAQYLNTNQQHLKSFAQQQREENHPTLPLDIIAPTSIPWALSPSSPFNFPEINNSESWPQVKFPVCRIIDSKKYDLHGDYQQPFNHHNSTWFDVPKTALRWQASPVLPFESEEIRSASCTANLLSSNPSKGQNKCIDISSKQHQLSSQTPATDADQGGDQGKHSCKLFGFSLIEEPACIDDAISSRIPRAGVTMNFLHMAHDQEPVQSSILRNLDQPLKDLHDHSEGLESSEHQITFQTISKVPTSVPALGRKCTKVHKQGNIVGRAVDLSKLDGYDELISELERLFNMEGLLNDPEKGWQVVYTDNENDIMLVGDDPWQEFCNIVCKILIYTHEEVEKMAPGMFSDDAQSCSDEQPAIIEVSKSSIDCQDSCSPPATRI
eukprot:Gb_17831 [translate_table: standard]